MSDRDWMLVEFEGTYTSHNPSGVKGSKITKPFRVQVEMEKRFLDAYSLRAVFHTYYLQTIKREFPDMIDLHRFRQVEATELDGTKINHPHAMSHQDLLEYIKQRNYPINALLFDDQELRNEVRLYEKDKDGQQKLQAHREKTQGGALEMSRKITSRPSAVRVLPVSESGKAQHEAVQKAIDTKAVSKSPKEQQKAAKKGVEESRVTAAEADAQGSAMTDLDDMLGGGAYGSEAQA